MSISIVRTRRLAPIVFFAAALALGAFALTPESQAQDDSAQGDSVWDNQEPYVAPVATDIVTGQVTAVASVETENSVYTVATIAVSDRELGDTADEIQVQIPGGVLADGKVLFVSHQPVFDVYSTVRLELLAAPAQLQAELGIDAYALVGDENGFTRLDAPATSTAASTDFAFFGHRVASFPTSFSIVAGAPASVEAAFVNGAFDWERETCSTIDVEYDGQRNLDPWSIDGVNMVGPSNTNPFPGDVLARVLFDFSLDEIVEWEIVFNPAAPFSVGGVVPGTIDIETIMRHEFGHILGLAHNDHVSSTASNEVMFSTFFPQEVTHLGTGDRTAATMLYPAHPFTDVTPLAFYERPVAWLTETGITTGTSASTYSPSAPVTRAQMATFLYRLAGSPPVTGTTPFVDVPATGTFYSAPVLWLLQSGITTGTSPTTYGPNEIVSRAQMATFLYRFAGSPAVSGTTPFVDVPATGTFFSTPVLWLQQSGITTGTSPTTYSPLQVVTRAQMATFLHRYEGSPETC